MYSDKSIHGVFIVQENTELYKSTGRDIHFCEHHWNVSCV